MQLFSSAEDVFFIQFQQDVSSISLPEKFTFPFNYEPHQIAKIAAIELQNYIAQAENLEIDKMFGVLVVKDKLQRLGYLAAFSGNGTDSSNHPFFVPPIVDILDQSGFFKLGEQEINIINEKVNKLQSDARYKELQQQLVTYESQAEYEINEAKDAQKQGKVERDIQRKLAETIIDENERNQLLSKLNHQSASQSTFLKDTKNKWRFLIEQTKKEISNLEIPINTLKEQRKKVSFDLQNRLFEHYIFLNALKKTKSIAEIFSTVEHGLPPSGAGDCAAPKLLQYAFENDYIPIALAEFWWGASPVSEIRKHGHYYPACKNKCFPILTFMLEGMNVDADPTLIQNTVFDDLEICYEDEYLLVINKPQGLLSVPGSKIDNSVYTIMKKKYPNATGPLIVHRLDQATSGVMLIPKTMEVYHHLQQQFLAKTIKKRYVALLEGEIIGKSGEINLPLRVDLDNRPQQLVCYEYGKPSLTLWEVIDYQKDRTRVNFYPISGRTHQLRVHASHSFGLNAPIVGDELYGTRKERLYLHAEEIVFIHPIKGELMKVVKKADF